MAKKTLKRSVVPVPNNLDEAAEFVRSIGEKKRTVEKLFNRLNEKIEKLKAEAKANSEEHEKKIGQYIEGLYIYAEGQREELTDGNKKKTIKVISGTFGWRMTPPAVSLKEVKDILAALKKRGLKRFIRVKEEPDKEAMLKEPNIAKKVKGVSIGQHEEFVVKPNEVETEIVTRIKK